MTDTPADGIITYDKLYYSDTGGYIHTLDEGLNITTGVYTAPDPSPYPGKCFIDVS